MENRDGAVTRSQVSNRKGVQGNKKSVRFSYKYFRRLKYKVLSYLTTCISVNATKQERSYGVEEDGFFLEVACACAYEWNACLQCPRRRPLLWLCCEYYLNTCLLWSESKVFVATHIVHCLSFWCPVAEEVQFHKAVQHKKHADCEWKLSRASHSDSQRRYGLRKRAEWRRLWCHYSLVMTVL